MVAGLEAIRAPAVLVGKAFADFEATETWRKGLEVGLKLGMGRFG